MEFENLELENSELENSDLEKSEFEHLEFKNLEFENLKFENSEFDNSDFESSQFENGCTFFDLVQSVEVKILLPSFYAILVALILTHPTFRPYHVRLNERN